MYEVSCNDEQKVRVTLVPVTSHVPPRPAKLDGPPSWEVTSGDAKIVVDSNGLSAELISGDLPGDSSISVTADADLGAGVVPISEVIVLHVTGARAESLGITSSLPEPK